MEFINTAILKNPFNWATVLLMLVFFALLADTVLRHYNALNILADPMYTGQ